MKAEVFYVSIDPHSNGQFRLIHDGKTGEIWDFESTSEAITFRRIISIVDYYSLCEEIKARIYFEDDALNLITARMTSIENELYEYKHFMDTMVYPPKEKTVTTTNGNRLQKNETSLRS